MKAHGERPGTLRIDNTSFLKSPRRRSLSQSIPEPVEHVTPNDSQGAIVEKTGRRENNVITTRSLPANAFEVREIRTPGDLDAFRGVWSELLAQTPGASFFQSLDWLQVYSRHAGASRDWRVLIARDGDAVVGILPLVVRSDRTPIGVLRTLTYPLDDWGTFYGPIGPRPAETLAAGLRFIQQNPRDWDVFDLRWVGSDEVDPARTREAMQAAGLTPHGRLLNEVAIVDLEGTWCDYFASRPAKWRENVRHAERKAAAAAQIEHIHYRPRGRQFGDDDPRWDLYVTCEQISARSWQGSAAWGTTLSHDSVRPFLREAHAAAVRQGCAEIHLLAVGGLPAAFLYNYVYAGHVYGLRAGFDPAFGHLEVGKLLLGKAIEQCFALNDHTYDLGPNQIEYKRRWATRIVGSYSHCYYPTTDYRAQVLRWQRQMRYWLKPPNEHQPRSIA